MNKILILTCVVLAPSIASAADMVVYSPPAVSDTFTSNLPVSPPSWDGGYIGLNTGWVQADFQHIIRQYLRGKTGLYLYDETISDSVESNHFLGGVQAGYNWQVTNNIVAGLETDFQLTKLKGTTQYSLDRYPDTQFDVTSKLEWFGTVRARVGFVPIERVMIYATGGFAYGKVKSSITRTGPNDFLGYDGANLSKINTGWTAGGGTEYAINDKWNLKLEYLYMDLGKNSIYREEPDWIEGSGLFVDRKVTLQTVRVGLNYKF